MRHLVSPSAPVRASAPFWVSRASARDHARWGSHVSYVLVQSLTSGGYRRCPISASVALRLILRGFSVAPLLLLLPSLALVLALIAG